MPEQTVQFDQPIAAPPATVNFDSEEPGAASRFGSGLLTGAGVTSNEEAKDFFRHPIRTAGRMLSANRDIGNQAYKELGEHNYGAGLSDLLDSAIPVLGPAMSRAGHKLESGDIAGGAGETLGLGGSILAGEGAARGIGRIARPAPLPPHPGAFEADPLGEIPVTRPKVSEPNPAALGKTPAPRIPGPNRPMNVRGPGEIPPTMIRPRAYFGGVPAEPIPSRTGLALPGDVAPPEPTALRPLNIRRPGEIAPEMPRPRAFFGGIPPEPIPPRQGLMLEGETAPAQIPPRALSKTLDTTLGKAVGAKPIEIKPGVSMRNQPKPEVPAPQIPEGHTPATSTALKSYKYDPATQEMHITAKDGTIHVYGEVTPEQAEAFRTADSKGLAWKAIRDNNVKLAKISPEGVRTPNKGASEFRSVGPESTAAPPSRIAKPNAMKPAADLTSQLDNSLAAVKRNRSMIPRGESNASRGQLGAEGQSQAVPGPRQPSTPPAAGTETNIRVPGEDRTYPATYQVRELADVQPSHSGINFNPNEKYALTNDRDYSNPANQGKIVTNSAPGKFDPAYHITDNPDATNGPVVIDSDGHALGGNGRSMILQRVYKYNPEGAQAYKDLLVNKAQNFGLDRNAISQMKEPILVREISDEHLGPAAKQGAITDFNKSGTAEMTPAERAIADSRRISQGTLDHIAGQIESQGGDASLADVMRGQSGTQILDRLINDGVLTPQERAAYANESGLTEAGKERISKLVVGRFFRDPIQIDTTPPSLRNKLEAMAAPLARVDGVEGWDLTPKIQDAIDLMEEARTHGTGNLDDLLSQQGLFGNTRYSPEAVTLAKRLQAMPGRALAKSVRQYAQDAADAQRPLLLGNTVSPEEAFKDAFEKDIGTGIPQRIPPSKMKSLP